MRRNLLTKPIFSIIISLLLGFQADQSSQEKHSYDFEPYAQTIPGTEVVIEMVPVKGGSFIQGSQPGETGSQASEHPAFSTSVNDFWMGKYEITWQQYELFMQRAIDEFAKNSQKNNEIQLQVDGVTSATTPYVDMSFGMGKIDYPAINVTQYAASMFCKWLSAVTGNYYRLPTESEWEYACRAGSQTAYHFGNDPEKLKDYGWYYDNSDDQYHQVGQKKPNAFGLYDMHGNVAEWTLDQYSEDYYKTLSSKGVN